MDIEKREWRVNPPREPMTSLAAMLRDFKWRFPRDKRDMVWEFCRTAPTFDVAVERAVRSRDANNKMHNHQSRVSWTARAEFGGLIIGQKQSIHTVIRRAKRRKELRQAYADPFDEMHDIMDQVKPPGIGPVTLYDVATRVGAFLDVHPTSLYLHAGVRHGLVALHDATVPPGYRGFPLDFRDINYGERITDITLFRAWPEFKGMTPDEVEDFLCTYRAVFNRIEVL